MRLDSISSGTATISSASEVAQVQSNENKINNGEVGEVRRVKNERALAQERKFVEDQTHSEENIIDLIEKANEEFVAYDRRFEFSIHEKTKQIMVKILDTSTDEIIKELPPEKVLDIVAGIWEVAGIIVDEKI